MQNAVNDAIAPLSSLPGRPIVLALKKEGM
jgi:hypothetical protein